MPTFKPDSYTSVSPYLIVDGAPRTIDFLIDVFRAAELRRDSDPSGGLRHAEVRLDDSVIMIADAADDWPPMAAHVHVYVSDVDAVYQRALAAGALSVQEPSDKDDGDRRGGVKDAGGTTWWIATRMA